jgi:hypothetical protein
VTGLRAQRQGDRKAAAAAFEEALRHFEQIGRNPDINDQRPLAQQLLASVREGAK